MVHIILVNSLEITRKDKKKKKKKKKKKLIEWSLFMIILIMSFDGLFCHVAQKNDLKHVSGISQILLENDYVTIVKLWSGN